MTLTDERLEELERWMIGCDRSMGIIGRVTLDLKSDRQNWKSCLALLSELRTLRAERNETLRECARWAHEAGSELARVIEGWKDRAAKAEAELSEIRHRWGEPRT